ncbi:hypothetical protein ACIPY5_15085 [Microbacterium sp. NPDC089698]|uniref:hypothetical protein n=1 Tax=Microbacterium sp. NPDC089698 TaxID=3364200 RepID=UPI0037FEC086
MTETEHQRNIRKTWEATEQAAREAARTADWQQQSALQQQRTARAAEEAAAMQREARDLQEQVLHEQRHATFAMWRQTPDGQAFNNWTVNALQLVDEYDRNTSDFDAAWSAARERAQEAITASERQQHERDVYVPGRPPMTGHHDTTLYLAGTALIAVAVVILVIMGIGALFNGGTPWFGLEWVLVPFGLGLTLLVCGKVVAARHPEWADESRATMRALEDWKKANAHARTASAESRLERFGFDPLAEPDRSPAPWTTDPHPGPWMYGFVHAAMTALPAAHELPPLPHATVRDPDTEPVPELRDELRRMSRAS